MSIILDKVSVDGLPPVPAGKLALVGDTVSGVFACVDEDGVAHAWGSGALSGTWMNMLPPSGDCVSIPLGDALPSASVSGSVHAGGA